MQKELAAPFSCTESRRDPVTTPQLPRQTHAPRPRATGGAGAGAQGSAARAYSAAHTTNKSWQGMHGQGKAMLASKTGSSLRPTRRPIKTAPAPGGLAWPCRAASKRDPPAQPTISGRPPAPASRQQTPTPHKHSCAPVPLRPCPLGLNLSLHRDFPLAVRRVELHAPRASFTCTSWSRSGAERGCRLQLQYSTTGTCSSRACTPGRPCCLDADVRCRAHVSLPSFRLRFSVWCLFGTVRTHCAVHMRCDARGVSKTNLSRR